MERHLDLFSFTDYRAYLKKWLDEARASQTFNLTRLAQALRVHTSFLGHVLSGSKSLSLEQAAELCELQKLTPLERDYFFSLIQIDKAGTQKLKKYWLEKQQAILLERTRIRSRVGNHFELSEADRVVFYTNWLYVGVLLATSIEEGQTLEQIAFRFRISRTKAEEIVLFLVQRGICIFENNLYKMGPSVVFLDNNSPLVAKHHSNWRMRALNKIDQREEVELFYTGPMTLSLEDFRKIKSILSNAIESSLQICKDSPPVEIACLNIDFFRLSAD